MDSPIAVELSQELLNFMANNWTPAIQVKVERDPHSSTGWTMLARTPDATAAVDALFGPDAEPDPVATQPTPGHAERIVSADGQQEIFVPNPEMETALAEIYREHQRRCLHVKLEDPGDDTTAMRCNRDRGHFGATHADRYGRTWRA